MSTRNLPGGKRRPARKADNLIAICEPIVYKMWEPRRLTILWASTACYKDSFTLLPSHYICTGYKLSQDILSGISSCIGCVCTKNKTNCYSSPSQQTLKPRILSDMAFLNIYAVCGQLYSYTHFNPSKPEIRQKK
jgi:hypothetical protein